MNIVIKGGVIGGVIVFLWGLFSWTVLPWHEREFQQIEDETLLIETIGLGTESPGIYLIPHPSMQKPEDAGILQKLQARRVSGPFSFLVHRPEGLPSLGSSLLGGLLSQVLAACFVMTLLCQTQIRPYWGRVGFVLIFSLAAAMVGIIPDGTWWGYPFSYVITATVDLAVGWILAGLWMARAFVPERSRIGLKTAI